MSKEETENTLDQELNKPKFDNEYIKPIFYLVIGSVFKEIMKKFLGSKVDNLLLTNRYFKHVFLIFVIYFSQELGDQSERINPSITLLLSIGIWLVIVMFSKLNMFFTIVVISLLFISFILRKYSNYYKKRSKKESIRNLLDRIATYKKYAIGAVIFIGFLYAIIQESKKKSTFNFLTFLFK